jgi:ADP-dependent NAD(P)H-hydrate dehydratase / NAD(P)H-hydrate epimerase
MWREVSDNGKTNPGHSQRPLNERIWDHDFSSNVDRLCQDSFGLPGIVLMERAGMAVAQLALKIKEPSQKIVVLAGAGNNGADALVVARLLTEKGYTCDTILAYDRISSKVSAEHKVQLDICRKMNVSMQYYRFGCLTKYAAQPCLVIDGIFGLGWKAPLRGGPAKDCIEEISRLEQTQILSIDIPSGLSCDQWQVICPAIKAQHTISFGGLKPIHCLEPSRSQCGTVHTAEVGFLNGAVQLAAEKSPALLHRADADSWLKRKLWTSLANDAHKFTRGHVLILGGSPGKMGAPLLSAKAALRSGMGWTSLGVAELPSAGSTVVHEQLELTYEQLIDDAGINAKDLAQFVQSRQVRTIILGPGWMQSQLNEETWHVLRELN